MSTWTFTKTEPFRWSHKLSIKYPSRPSIHPQWEQTKFELIASSLRPRFVRRRGTTSVFHQEAWLHRMCWVKVTRHFNPLTSDEGTCDVAQDLQTCLEILLQDAAKKRYFLLLHSEPNPPAPHLTRPSNLSSTACSRIRKEELWWAPWMIWTRVCLQFVHLIQRTIQLRNWPLNINFKMTETKAGRTTHVSSTQEPSLLVHSHRAKMTPGQSLFSISNERQPSFTKLTP